MKQTAVEYLVEQLIPKALSVEQYYHIRKAKEMEKEQIEDAYETGFADAWDDATYDDEPTYTGAEHYYNVTFNK
jgi:hypothetical protein